MEISPKRMQKRASMLVVALVAVGIFTMIFFSAISLAITQQRVNMQRLASEQALHIAEAGVNYYRWALYHEKSEHCNKESCLPGPSYGPYGPYEYVDSAGLGIKGKYELYITPPPLNGSTIVNIKSVGWVDGYPGIKRSIEVRCGIPSWSNYSALANDKMRFGVGTEIWGPVHANNGIRFDGVAHNIITSGALSYDDDDHTGANEFGVHTHIAPLDPLPNGSNPPNNVPVRNDVFEAGREFPVPIVSFNLLDSYVNEVYSKATSSGLVIDPGQAPWNCLASACDEGFHITLKNNNTIDIKKVSAVQPNCNGERSNSILTEDAVATNQAIPANGLIFVKHNVWVDGVIDGSRVTILAFNEPFVGGAADIYIANDIRQSRHDGTEAIGLIAQRDVSVAQYSEDDLFIEAALIAKSGRVGRNNYQTCSNNIKTTLTLNGAIATYARYGFAWSSGTTHVSGYQNRNLNYDDHLTYAPPPHFPSTGEYVFISWKED